MWIALKRKIKALKEKKITCRKLASLRARDVLHTVRNIYVGYNVINSLDCDNDQPDAILLHVFLMFKDIVYRIRIN